MNASSTFPNAVTLKCLVLEQGFLKSKNKTAKNVPEESQGGPHWPGKDRETVS